jgi:hypothetical protein
MMKAILSAQDLFFKEKIVNTLYPCAHAHGNYMSSLRLLDGRFEI